MSDKMKKFLRGPILWIALAGFAVFFGLQLGGQSGVTYKSVDTSYGLQLIKDGKAKSVAASAKLQPGERVVTDGQLRLVPGARVEIKASASPPAPGAGGG